MRAGLALFLLLSGVLAAGAKRSVTVLGFYAPALDSAAFPGKDSLAAGWGKALSEEGGYQVFDLRHKNASRIDRAYKAGRLDLRDLREALSSLGSLEEALVAYFEEAGPFLRLRVEAWPLGPAAADTEAPVVREIRFLPFQAPSPRSLMQKAVREAAALRDGKPHPLLSAPLLKKPLYPAHLLFDGELWESDTVKHFPIGGTVLMRDSAQAAELHLDGRLYALFPRSSYTYPLRGVLQLDSGHLALLPADSLSAALRGLPSLGKKSDTLFLLTPGLRLALPGGMMHLSYREGLSEAVLLKGTASASPALGTGPSAVFGAGKKAASRGYEVGVAEVSPEEGRRLSEELGRHLPKGLLDFIPRYAGLLLGDGGRGQEGRPRPPSLALQRFMEASFAGAGTAFGLGPLRDRGFDSGPDRDDHHKNHLERPARAGLGGPAEGAGCYLCNPEKRGP